MDYEDSIYNIDIEQAQSFLTSLAEGVDNFTFQTFDDNSDRKDKKLSKIIHGSLDDPQVVRHLVDLNRRGAGVFVTVNETDGRGRKLENITRVRAVWQECDHGDAPLLPCEPHIVVQSSPGKYHRYILTDDAPIDEVAGVQERLIRDYGSDPAAKDLARVLRLPGFFHQKVNSKKHLTGERHMVRMELQSQEQPFTWERIKQLFPPIPRKPAPTNTPQLPKSAKLAEILGALAALDPDCDYEVWLSILMSIHAATGGSQEGLDIADAWSQRGSSYRDGDVEYRWNSFTLRNQDGITKNTLFDMAHKAGWDNSVPATEETTNSSKSESGAMLEDFNSNHAQVLLGGKSMVVWRQPDNVSTANGRIIRRMTTNFYSPSEMKSHFAPLKIPVVTLKTDPKTKEKIEMIAYKQLFPIWQQMEGRRTYSGVVFDPQPGMIAGGTKLPDGDVYNLYQGLSVTPRPGKHELILNHIYHIWCGKDDDSYWYVLHWLARMLQNPGERGMTVIALRSGQGSGKDVIISIFMRALGEHAVMCTRAEDLTGKFNDHLATSILVYANEALWGGDKRSEGALKSLVTDETLSIEKKFLSKYEVNNCSHVMMSSNADWMAPMDADDRRFFVLDVSDSKRSDSLYFKALIDEIETGGRESLIHFLLSLDISEFKPQNMPANRSNTRIENKMRSAGSIPQWWYEVLLEGEINVQVQQDDGYKTVRETISLIDSGLNIGTEDGIEKWSSPAVVPTSLVYDAYRQWAKDHNKHIDVVHSFGITMSKLMPERPHSSGIERRQMMARGKRAYYYVIPPLDECRESARLFFHEDHLFPDTQAAQ